MYNSIDSKSNSWLLSFGDLLTLLLCFFIFTVMTTEHSNKKLATGKSHSIDGIVLADRTRKVVVKIENREISNIVNDREFLRKKIIGEVSSLKDLQKADIKRVLVRICDNDMQMKRKDYPEASMNMMALYSQIFDTFKSHSDSRDILLSPFERDCQLKDKGNTRNTVGFIEIYLSAV